MRAAENIDADRHATRKLSTGNRYLWQVSANTPDTDAGVPAGAAAALAPLAMRPTAAEQEAEKQAKARAALAAQQMVIEMANRKEKAWAAYYVAPDSCEHPPAWKDQVDCGNQYIRAKREFEQQRQAHIATQ